MFPIVTCVTLLIVIAAYYMKVAKGNNRNSLGYAFLGFLMPLLPFIIFSLFIIVAHLILGHDPKFHLGKSLVLYGMLFYMIFVLLLPQFLQKRWRENKSS